MTPPREPESMLSAMPVVLFLWSRTSSSKNSGHFDKFDRLFCGGIHVEVATVAARKTSGVQCE